MDLLSQIIANRKKRVSPVSKLGEQKSPDVVQVVKSKERKISNVARGKGKQARPMLKPKPAAENPLAGIRSKHYEPPDAILARRRAMRGKGYNERMQIKSNSRARIAKARAEQIEKAKK
ncbi:MAG: hypothetical protein DRQ88_09315 [Epsilonproteobacteria bacterium]|nr:MAG: hypothetical protein DRQ88_09315 [Campylobacterota bacterium]